MASHTSYIDIILFNVNMYKNVMLNIPHELENMIFEYLSVSEKNYFFLDIKIMLRFRNKDVYIDRDAHRISFTSVQNSRFYYTSCDKIPCLFDVDCLKIENDNDELKLSLSYGFSQSVKLQYFETILEKLIEKFL